MVVTLFFYSLHDMVGPFSTQGWSCSYLCICITASQPQSGMWNCSSKWNKCLGKSGLRVITRPVPLCVKSCWKTHCGGESAFFSLHTHENRPIKNGSNFHPLLCCWLRWCFPARPWLPWQWTGLGLLGWRLGFDSGPGHSPILPCISLPPLISCLSSTVLSKTDAKNLKNI